MALLLRVSHSLPYSILTVGETEAHDVFAGSSRFQTGV